MLILARQSDLAIPYWDIADQLTTTIFQVDRIISLAN